MISAKIEIYLRPNRRYSMKREQKIYRVTILGSIVNVLLLIFKFTAGVLGHSAAMIADAVHSLSDFLTSSISIRKVCIFFFSQNIQEFFWNWEIQHQVVGDFRAILQKHHITIMRRIQNYSYYI